MKDKFVKIAVITDIHFGKDSPLSERRNSLGATLLTSTVKKLNTQIHPDVILILGDLLNDGNSDESEKNLCHLKSILDNLDSPYLAIPGNHDGDPNLFYQVFDRPNDCEDIGGVRFLPFIDKEEPDYNASRSKRDLDRFKKARAGYNGPLVSLQHVCLSPPENQTIPYNYINAQEMIEGMESADVTLSVSGHYHGGTKNYHVGKVTLINAPCLCESPFLFLEITLDQGKIETKRHEINLP